MAETVIFEDGAHAVLLTAPDNTERRGPELLRLIRDKLGPDMAAAVERWQAELEQTKAAIAQESHSMETSCDCYRAALQDVQESLEEVVLALRFKPRVPRADIQKRLQRCIDRIKNEL